MRKKQRHLTPEEMAEILQNTMVEEEEPTLWDDFKQLCRWIFIIIGIIAIIIIVALCADNEKNSSSPAKPATVSTGLEEVKTQTHSPSNSNATGNVTTPPVTPKAKTTIKSEATGNIGLQSKTTDKAVKNIENQPPTQVQNDNVDSTPETMSGKDAKQQAKAQRKAEKEQRKAERKAKRQANSSEE